MDKYLKKVLKKMCKYVGITLKDINTIEPEWYNKHLWTIKEENSFKKWLKQYLVHNKYAREELMNIPSKNQYFIDKFCDEFVLNFGWRFK